MRRTLDTLYLWSGYLAAVFLVMIALTIIAQIGGRFVGIAIDSTESAGFSLAGSTFLGLAYTFRHDGHIRVTLLTRFATGTLGKMMELWAIGFCAVAMGYLTYWSFDLVYFSYVFGDISPGLLAIPFWIPRSAMAIGTLILTIALIDEFVSVLCGKTPSYIVNATPIYSTIETDDASEAR
ncbi:MAG: TRAP transporter small permease [Alphaproteobacteria bacterium]|nr:TRAP transporter small permease [Alphaproteobacteria bacterium]